MAQGRRHVRATKLSFITKVSGTDDMIHQGYDEAVINAHAGTLIQGEMMQREGALRQMENAPHVAHTTASLARHCIEVLRPTY